jgi:hypothetical protein
MRITGAAKALIVLPTVLIIALGIMSWQYSQLLEAGRQDRIDLAACRTNNAALGARVAALTAEIARVSQRVDMLTAEVTRLTAGLWTMTVREAACRRGLAAARAACAVAPRPAGEVGNCVHAPEREPAEPRADVSSTVIGRMADALRRLSGGWPITRRAAASIAAGATGSLAVLAIADALALAFLALQQSGQRRH